MEFQARRRSPPRGPAVRSHTRAGSNSCAQVLITGLKVTQPALVARNLQLNPGDPLSPTAITDTQRRLYDLGVFAKVDAAIENPDGETDRKYVLYDMEEAARYSLATGVGAELARIGGCTTCLGAGRDNRVSRRASRGRGTQLICGAWGTASACARASPRSTAACRAEL